MIKWSIQQEDISILIWSKTEKTKTRNTISTVIVGDFKDHLSSWWETDRKGEISRDREDEP